MRNVLIASLAAIALPALLGGCGTVNRGVESVHQPVVSRTDYAFDVATSGNGLAPGEARRLSGWMQSLNVGYGDRVSIDDPSPYGSGVRDDVAAQTAQFGLLVADTAPVTAGQIAPGTVRVVISRMHATVPGCPDYSRGNGSEFNSNTSSNMGCSINSNLAAMVANPGDLVRGSAGADGGDPNTNTKAISTYRAAATTGSGGLKNESTGGK